MTTSIGRRIATGLLLAALLTACAETGTGTGMILADDSSHPTAPPTPRSTSKPAPAEVPTETHSGHKGQTSVPLAWPMDEPGYLTFDCPKCKGNIVVETDGNHGLLINAIGPYHGTRWFNTGDGRRAADLAVTADADWTMTIADFRSVPMTELGKPMSGKGDAVVRVPEGTANVELTGKGPGNFQVWVTVDNTVDLVVNEIGNFQTSVPLKGPAFVEIGEWEGSWTIKPS